MYAKKVMIISLLLGFMLWSSVADAATWTWMGSTDTSGYHVDTSSLKAVNTPLGVTLESWFKVEYVPPKELKNGMATYALKKIKYTFYNSGLISVGCDVSKVTFYDSEWTVVYDHLSYLAPSSSFSPGSENELCFAALIDYMLGTNQLWLQRLSSFDRWTFASLSANKTVSAWIDQYSFDADPLNKTASVYTSIYNTEKDRIRTERRSVDVRKKTLDSKDVTPETVGEDILEKVDQLINNPTPEMREWQQAIIKLKAKVKPL